MPLITDKAPFAIDFVSSPSRNCCDRLVAITSYDCNAWFTYTDDTKKDNSDLSYLPNNNPTSCDPATLKTSDTSTAQVQLPFVNNQSLYELSKTMYIELNNQDFDTYIPTFAVEEDLKKYYQSLPLIINATVPTTARLRVVRKVVNNNIAIDTKVLSANDEGAPDATAVWNNTEQGIYVTVA